MRLKSTHYYALLFFLAGGLASSALAESRMLEYDSEFYSTNLLEETILPSSSTTKEPSCNEDDNCNSVVDECNTSNFSSRVGNASAFLSSACTPVPGQIDIEGTVYEDLNEDGTLDPGETGEAGIAVDIYRDTNSDGQVDAGDIQMATVNTDATGSYAFTFPPPTGTITDDFSTGNFSGGSGWSADWTVMGDAVIISGEAQVENNGSIYRTANLGIAASASISFNYDHDSYLETDDRYIVEICSDASFGTCQTLLDMSDDFAASSISNVAINSNILTTTTTLRARTIGYTTSTEEAFIDNIVINYTNTEAGDYLIQVDTNSLASDATLTTDNIESAVFTVTGQKDCDNDFGYTLTDSDGDNIPDRDDLDDDNDGILDTDEGQFTVGSAELNVVSAIPAGAIPGDPQGLRLSDIDGQLILDIYLGANTTPGEAVNFNTLSGEIGGTNTSGTLTNSEVVELVYTTQNSPVTFDLQSITINDIQSLDGPLGSGSVRDAFVWGEPGTWTPTGTPAGAVVSVDPVPSDKVGIFVLDDPDGNNDLPDIGSFDVVYDVDNSLSDVLLNMAGSINGHTVEFDFVNPHTTASLFVFNSGGSSAFWEFLPQLSVEINRTLGPDTDSDGTPDYLDLDSDNDGCPDFVEGGGTFVSADGTAASGTVTDGNGALVTTNLGANSEQTDPALLGVPIVSPATTAVTQGVGGSIDGIRGASCPCLDTDGDGVCNTNDIDSDNDGIPDDVEIASATNGGDSDGDGIPDHLDLDSDNDGIPDLIEAGGTDTNGDGVVDDACNTAACDADGDGMMDSVDAVDDTVSGVPTTGTAGTLLPVLDSDGDGQPDFQDLDSDNDGINDISEAGITDANNDGIIDGVNPDGTLSTDIDGDGFGDSLDPDNNNTPGTDTLGTPAITTDPDADADGQPDDDDNDGTAYNGGDTDGDGAPDFRDLDSDNDGINDIYEGGNAAADTNGDGVVNSLDTGYADTDSDGIPDSLDETPNGFGNGDVANPNDAPTDSDGDGVPNFQDLDSDNDGINDVVEGGNTDTDGDGLVDNPTVDTDGDGIPDSVDGASGFGDETGTANDPTNTDGTDTPDYIDLDSDNDGTTDFEENGGDPTLDTSPTDGAVDNTTDTDGDGIPDVLDDSNGFGDSSGCGSAEVTYAITDGTSNTTGYQWNGTADVASTNQYGLVRTDAFCESGSWRHYYNSNEPTKILFSVEMGSNTTEIDYVEIRVAQDPTSLYDTVATSAIMPMSRDWHVKTVADAALTANVNVRFYYVPAELKTALDNAIALAATDPAATAPTNTDIVWFKKDTYDPANDLTGGGLSMTNDDGYTSLTAKTVANANGESETTDGVNYVQFDGVTGFSGGGAYVMVSGAALPVTLTSFTATTKQCDVELYWASATEDDFSHYELEWSQNGRTFKTINEQTGSVASVIEKSYAFTHTAAANQNYYRLKMVDLDGRFEYSETIVVQTSCSTASMTVFPNPVSKASSNFMMNYEGRTSEVVEFYITDMWGRIVKQLNYEVTPMINNRLSVDIDGLATGTYFIGVTDPVINVPVTKFIVVD